MATNRKSKRKPRKRARRRSFKNISELSKLDTHYLVLHEMYKAAKRNGFSDEMAFWLITEPGAHGMPDWAFPIDQKTIIPKIDPDEDDD
jgi:hypothetical protein